MVGRKDALHLEIIMRAVCPAVAFVLVKCGQPQISESQLTNKTTIAIGPHNNCDPGPQGLYPRGTNRSNSIQDAVRNPVIQVESPSKEEAMEKMAASRKEDESKRSKPPEDQSEETGEEDQSVL
ncbi:hypothetical protein NDU88_006706 [Pleurodeles waltl]|uniref:Uncharacterized protein n=1 Tax=Pleurodeles waltl TaxID=8319 RepID=A0AAV7RSS6_PLEWA|nr:hypothetical protein NDU88_006706 [Pleurodeles waltl]